MDKMPNIEQSIEDHNKTEDYIYESLNERLPQAPKIESKSLLSLGEIADRHNTTLENLQETLVDEVNELVSETHDAVSLNESFYPLVDTLYQLWRHSEMEGGDTIPMMEHMNSIDEFIDNVAPHASAHSKAYIGKYVQGHSYLTAHHPRLMETRVAVDREVRHKSDTADWKIPIYESESDWVLAPSRWEWSESFEYVDREVIHEVISLLESGYKAPDYSHASGSAALSGITRQKKILSANNAAELGESVNTGEFATYFSNDFEHGSKHGSVYASQGNPHYGYNVVRWFNEHPVSFGINRERQEEFLKSQGFEYKYSHEEDGKLRRDLGGEGTLIGDAVPLEALDYVYCWKNKMEEMQGWVDENTPHTKLVSLEAIELLQNLDEHFNKKALEGGVDPIEVWKQFAEYQQA